MTTTQIGQAVGVEKARALYAEGQYDLSLSELAKVIAETANQETRVSALILKACIESEKHQYSASLRTLKLAARKVDLVPPKLRARFYGQRAHLRVQFGKLDKALVDYEAARFWAQLAGDDLSLAIIHNNLAKVSSGLGAFDDAVVNSDTAIKLFLRLGEKVYLGRAYDQRARVHIENEEFADALSWSQKAMSLLGSHPLLLGEARTTHAQALIGLAGSYLEDVDRVDRFRVYRSALDRLKVPIDPDLIRKALQRTEGNIKQAAALLNIPRPSLIREINRLDLTSHQRRHHRRTVCSSR